MRSNNERERKVADIRIEEVTETHTHKTSLLVPVYSVMISIFVRWCEAGLSTIV